MIRGASTAMSATPGKIFIVVTWVLFKENRKTTKKIIDLTTKKKVRIYLCPLSLSFKSLPHLKCGTFFSGTRTESPVFGFLPTLAGRQIYSKRPESPNFYSLSCHQRRHHIFKNCAHTKVTIFYIKSLQKHIIIVASSIMERLLRFGSPN